MRKLVTESALDAFAAQMLSAVCNRGSCAVSPASAFAALEALARGSEGETFEEINTKAAIIPVAKIC